MSYPSQISISQRDEQRIIMLEQAGKILQVWPEMRPAIGEMHIVKYEQVWPAYRRAIALRDNGETVSVRIHPKSPPEVGAKGLVTLTAQPFESKRAQAVMGAELAGSLMIMRQSARQGMCLRSSKKQHTSTPDIAENAGWKDIEEQLMHKGERLLPAFGGVEIILRRSASRISDLSQLSDEADYLVQTFCSALDQSQPFDSRTIRHAPLGCLFGGFDGLALARMTAPDAPIIEITADAADSLFAQIDRAAGTRIDTEQGAVFWAESTRAGLMIDCDGAQTGYTATQLASTLVPEIMRLIRLRNPSGRIVIDFPYMNKPDQGRITQAIHHYGAEDNLISDIFGFTRSGLFEMVRRHSTPPLEQWWQLG